MQFYSALFQMVYYYPPCSTVLLFPPYKLNWWCVYKILKDILMSSLRFWLASIAIHKPLTDSSRRLLVSSQRHSLHYSSANFCCCVRPIKQNGFLSDTKKFQASSSIPTDFPFSGAILAFSF